MPTARVDEFITVANGLDGGETTLVFEGPDGAGKTAGQDRVEVKGIYLTSIVQSSAVSSTLTMFDRRILLSQRVADKDYNVSFGDGFLHGTETTTVEAALRKQVAGIDVLNNYKAPDMFVGLPQTTIDTRLTAGLPLFQGLQNVLDASGIDLTVTLDGLFKFVTRQDVDPDALPSVSDYDWVQRPQWSLGANAVKRNVPRYVDCFYTIRQELEVGNDAVNARRTTTTPPELVVELTQVYAVKGSYMTLTELLAEFNLPNAITDAEIAGSIMTDTFQGTGIEADGTAETQEIIKAIKDGWRTLWRIDFPEHDGHLGGWTDWAFGNFVRDAAGVTDGGVDPTPVICQWAERLNVVDIDDASNQFVGAKTFINHAGTAAPFVAKWDNGPHNRVIRIGRKPLQDGNVAYPGQLERELGVVIKNTLEDESGFQANLKNVKVIDAEDPKLAKFERDFEIKIRMVATKRMPNSEVRWHKQRNDGDTNGGIERVELPVGVELLAYRDVDGNTLNGSELKRDSEIRTQEYLLKLSRSYEGDGLAERIRAFAEIELTGAVREVTIERDGNAIRTRVSAGNLGTVAARKRKAEKRRAMQQVAEAGKVVA